MKNVVRISESDLINSIKRAIGSKKEEPAQFYDEMIEKEEQKKAENFIKDIKAEFERPYMARIKNFDAPRKMRKPTLKEIIGAVKRIIHDYENM